MISIIIPTYNHLEDCLRPCLESVFKYTNLDNIEVIVSANGCTDGTREYVESLKLCKLIWNDKPLGYSGANNAAIREAKGDIIILLNNDCILLEQPKNQWIEMLVKPFKDESVGLTGPLLGYSEPAGHDFLVFFCVAIRKKVFDDVGLLDDQFGVGGGEDTSTCIDAVNKGWKMVRVPEEDNPHFDNNHGLMVGVFPIYHRGEATVAEDPRWNEIFERNSQILREKYNHQWKLGNNCERAVISATDDLTRFKREYTRYKWASENMTGKKVLELGSSSGYGTRLLPQDIDYVGWDYSSDVVEYAKSQFPQHKFEVHNLEKEQIEGFWDTIIAFEVLEHLENGKELAQELKKHCNTLLCTVPYKEIRGLWGMHHKHHQLTEVDFPGFEYKFINENGYIGYFPERFDGMNLLLMKSVQ